eukprot:765923-Hanusia_phi.AAC.2
MSIVMTSFPPHQPPACSSASSSSASTSSPPRPPVQVFALPLSASSLPPVSSGREDAGTAPAPGEDFPATPTTLSLSSGPRLKGQRAIRSRLHAFLSAVREMPCYRGAAGAARGRKRERITEAGRSMDVSNGPRSTACEYQGLGGVGLTEVDEAEELVRGDEDLGLLLLGELGGKSAGVEEEGAREVVGVHGRVRRRQQRPGSEVPNTQVVFLRENASEPYVFPEWLQRMGVFDLQSTMDVGAYPVGRRSNRVRVTVGHQGPPQKRAAALAPPIDAVAMEVVLLVDTQYVTLSEVVNSIYQSGVSLVNSSSFRGLWGMDVFVRDITARVQTVDSPFERSFFVVFVLGIVAASAVCLFIFQAVITSTLEQSYLELQDI